MGRGIVLRHPPGVKKISVHEPAPERKYGILSILIALHAVTTGLCVQTKGQAYEIALQKRRKVNREYYENGTKPPDFLEKEPLPYQWKPNPWASVSLFVSLSLHALFYLACHWKVSFRATAVNKPARVMREGCVVQVIPHAHRGKAVLAPVVRSEHNDKLFFEFQRQRYEYSGPDELADIDFDEEEIVGEVKLVCSPVDLEIPAYFSSTGLCDQDLQDLEAMYGENVITVTWPSFFEMYVERLLSPIVIYQYFIALLWAFDDFMSYTLTSLVQISGFEIISVVQQRNAQKMLSNMGSKAFPVKAYRDKRWQDLSTSELLPGDVIQLSITPASQGPSAPTAGSSAAGDSKDAGANSGKPTVGSDLVPCDCVVLRGEAVVNEASLTGESIPQMKEALVYQQRPLDINGVDRTHTLMSGTRLMRAIDGRSSEEDESRAATSLPPTPDGGCLCYVLRTGFSSAQGELMQMIEFSMEKVAPASREVIWALLLMSVIALMAAGYVLKVGLEKGEKTPHELLIKCIIILSSCVPRGLPMQTAIAVNSALMALSKEGVYCLEPFRVPTAGKLSHCFFDKTGTLTTDTLTPVGVVSVEHASEAATPQPTEVRDALPEAALVLAACHSLVNVDGNLAGDPIEVAAVQGVGWRYDVTDETSRPGNWEAADSTRRELEAELEKLAAAGPSLKQQHDVKKRRLEEVEKSIAEEKARGSRHPISSARILRRYRFSSKLQRMSVVASVETCASEDKSEPVEGAGQYCLVKGSPEALQPLLVTGSAPAWYEQKYVELSEKGLRLLALAYRKLPKDVDVAALDREEAEKDLKFAGFIMFECKLRSDSKLVIDALTSSDHTVSMLTGDAPLTALHVARQCGFSRPHRPALVLKVMETGGAIPRPVWAVATGDRRGEEHPLSTSLPSLAKDFTLLVTQDSLEAAGQEEPTIWEHLDMLQVYARMTPEGKAKVLREFQKHGKHVFMCGDGGNDVAALKQADVSLALLGGYGNVNTMDAPEVKALEAEGDGEEEADGEEIASATSLIKKGAEQSLNERQKAIKKRTRQLNALRKKFLADKQVELRERQKVWLEEEVEARTKRGETGVMVNVSAMGASLSRFQKELSKAVKEFDQQHGNVYDAAGSNGAAKEAKDAAAQAGAGMPIVSPGDASTAAAFTSRAPSIKHCVDIIRQGRCTLLSTLQQQQIMMLQCIISAACLSIISLEGSRNSERQLMATGWLTSIASLAFAYATPCSTMHPVRPLRSLFHPAVFLSMVGQAIIHLACLWLSVQWAREVMEPESEARQAGYSVGPSMQEVQDFWKRERMKQRGLLKEPEEEEDYAAMFWNMWDRPFLPNLMNTVVFLVETAQNVAVLFVNYKGQPWMKGLMENRSLFLSVFTLAGGVCMAVWEVNPEINGLLHLSPFPSDDFRWRVVFLVGMAVLGTFIWDRLCVAIFAPDIMKAMVQSMAATTFAGDIIPLFISAGKVIIGLIALCSGNLILIGGLFWVNRQMNKEED